MAAATYRLIIILAFAYLAKIVPGLQNRTEITDFQTVGPGFVPQDPYCAILYLRVSFPDQISLAHFRLILLFHHCSNSPAKAILSFPVPMLQGSHLQSIISIIILAPWLRFCRLHGYLNHLRIFLFVWEEQKYQQDISRDSGRVDGESMLARVNTGGQ